MQDEELTLTTLGDHGSPKIDDMEQPPAYDIAVKLPTYEEAQLGKIASEEQHGRIGVLNNGLHPEQRNFNFIASFTHPNSDPHFDSNVADLALGTDVYFFASFLGQLIFFYLIGALSRMVVLMRNDLTAAKLSFKVWLYSLYSCIFVQLDWISAADLCLPYSRWTLWCAGGIRTVASQMDSNC